MELVTCCVNAKANDIQAMVDQAKEVPFTVLARHCEIEDFEREMGYGPWLRMENDYAVSYYKSTYQGRPCYFVDHSAIEYVFTD